ncbi:PRC-barrel domain-containing protein [Pelomonas sp. CA6]|uniref:PRC-barrel domain-containing protein n=1 Tax=Pelomonas sp. CA6 TaxID=2907999 RepID=UPI001F4BD4E4|nr:PRC-barrel domain-containing protein [Pelomonas sp. CA6]MCH7344747.1 PRC-barrel domain-containing protein [Pelomonas sp. CA6]
MQEQALRTRGRTVGVSVLLSALLAAAGLPAVAQTSPSGSGTSAQSQAAAARDARVSQLIGKEVRNPQGEKLGEINDLIVDVNNEVIHYAILSFGGVMGLGDKLFAYPLSVFRHASDRDELVLDVDKERLKRAPGFERNRWPDWSSSDYTASVERHFGPTSRIAPRKNQHLLRASELIGKNVDDQAGKDAGEINDIVVSMANSRVRYVVLEFDKAWSLKDRLFPLPMKSLRFPAERRADLVLLMPREQLDTKQGFDKKQWPDVNDPNFRK